MNNKDLFNAINDIDEKFIADAGKYLTDDVDDPLHSGAVEIYPGKTHFSPLKLIASIAAAAVFITGVTIAVNHFRGRISIAPNAASEDTAISETVEPESNPDIGTHAITINVGPLPFELIGPDGKQICYEDITEVGGDIPVEELSEDNWETITCDFAYYALPSTFNRNSVDQPDIDYDNAANTMMTRSFRRIYEGGTYIDLTATKAYSVLKRETFEDPETGEPVEVTYLWKNYIEFSGSTTVNVYFVNDNGEYYCVFRDGADNLPIICYNVDDFIKTGEYRSGLCVRNFLNGSFKYAGDQLVLTLDEDEKAMIEPYLANSDYIKATVTLDNIKIERTQDRVSGGLYYNASIAKASLSYVTNETLFGETPFTAETETQLRAILGSAEDISELKNKADRVKDLTDCADIRVYRGIANMAGEFGEEITEGELTYGMVIELRNSEGERVAAYKYREDELTR